MADESPKKKVLALPIGDDSDEKVLLLEPGDEIQEDPTVPQEIPDEPAEPDVDDEPASADASAREDEDEAAAAEDEADEDRSEAPEETASGFVDKLRSKLPSSGDEGGFSLPFGGSDDEDEADEEPDAGETEDEPAEEPEPDETPDEPEEDEPTPELDEIALEAETLGVERIGEPAPGVSDVSVGDDETSVRLDPIPDEGPSPSRDEPGQAEPAEAAEERLDPSLVERIRYNVDQAIYETARESGAETVEDPGEKVDEVLREAESVEAEETSGGSVALPDAETSVDAVPGLDDHAGDVLREHGVETITDLRDADGVTVAIETGLRIQDIRDWQPVAELMHLPDVDPEHARILTEVGIHRVDVLAEQDPADLAKRVDQYRKYKRREGGGEVDESVAADWIDAAKQLRPTA